MAIGETGLDYHHLPSAQPDKSPDDDRRHHANQARIFQQQMEIAAEFGLNCVIHQRKALEDTLTQLQPFAEKLRGVFHCFADDAAAMRRIVAMYHDQGLVPLKMIGFDSGVNWTLGLPFIRTSPDHGTAFDIAGRGIANPASLLAALALAARLA